MNPVELPVWQDLNSLADQRSNESLEELIRSPGRSIQFTHNLAGCYFDFSKQWVNDGVQAKLLELASASGIMTKAQAMFSGELINTSEGRAVLHAALRHGSSTVSPSIKKDVAQVQSRLVQCVDKIRQGHWRGHTGKPILDVVHIGIGGSHLGPELVVAALANFKSTAIRLHFVANIDANDINQVLQNLNPDTTLFIIASKSFGTLETKINANTARSWFIERTGNPTGVSQHFVGVTSNVAAAVEFGLAEENLFPLWDWVGGRFSLWSAVGMPILLSIGAENFDTFLGGAREVDEHFISTPAERNVPLLSALYATWNYNFLGANSLVMLSYDERLELLPDYLQQLEMESNGKSVNLEGEPVQTQTMPILWGGTGTRGQHAYHQLLHQGTQTYCADFILVAKDPLQRREHHNWLIANALAQSQAMAIGYKSAQNEMYKNVPGNHPNTTIVMDELGPRQLGGLLALYEHKVFCQGVLWNINSFDQWGVELGKRLAEPIYATLAGRQSSNTAQDEATNQLIAYIESQSSNI